MSRDLTVAEPSETAVALDRQDERLTQRTGVRGALTDAVKRVRTGDLGALPVVIGVILIWIVFQSLNPIFLSSANLSNLAVELAPVGIISLGVVTVLLVGQIDLSVGSLSGLSAAITAVTFARHGWPLWVALVMAIGAGVVTGWFYGQTLNRFGIPSFVATLAGLLAFLGLMLSVLGVDGSTNIPFDSPIVRFAQVSFITPVASYALVFLVSLAMFLLGVSQARSRRRAGLSAGSTSYFAVRSVALLAVGEYAAWYLNRSRGIGSMFVLFVVLVIVAQYCFTHTKWGTSLFAVGGNAEAARRAGINVRAIYTSAFIMCSTLAAVGGVLSASRLASANQNSGTGDVNLNAIAAAVIGGTSLFGGRGSAYSALLGMIVIQSISSGLTLLNLSSAIRFEVTGGVLLLAVAVDSIARKSRSSHGRA